MQEISSYQNQMLIAMPSLQETHFHHGVTFICQHNKEGALGLVVNRPTDMIFSDILEQMDIDATTDKIANITIFTGGPVQQERGFVLHQRCGDIGWENTLNISETLALTTSRDILESIANGEGPEKFIITLGYAGWSSQQLEKEVKENAWLNIDANESIMFDTPISQRWRTAAKTLGLDISLLTTHVGHA